MTATKSPKFSPTTLHYLMHGGIRNFKIMVVMTVLNLVGFPLAMIFATFELSVDNYSSTSALFFILGIIFTAVSVLVGIVIAVNNFTYLNKKQNVDMYCSLPLTNLKRFTCDFVSGLLCYIAPIVISGIVLMITSGICFMVSPILSKGLGMTGAVFAGLIASVYFKGIVAMLMFYAFAVFVQCICGSLFESIMYTLILNALVPGTILVTIFIFLSQCYGVAMEQYLVPAISFSSPIGALIYFLMGLDNYSGEAQMLNFFTSFHLKWFIGMILITALIILASYYLYTKRKAEDVSKPFVFRGFYYIFISIISLCIGTLFIFGSEAIIPTIALMVIVYLIFEVVNKRGFKKFGYSVMRCLITLVTVFIVISIAFLTEGFGIGYKVPKASSVESVNVSYGSLNSNDYYFDSESIYTFYDEKSIQAVIDSQESAIDRYKETKDTGYFGNHSYYGIGYDYYNYDSTLRHVSIEYKLKSGRTIKREYSMTIDDLNHLVNIEVSPDYAKQVEKKIIDECSIDIDRDYMNVRSHDYINLNAMNIMGTYVGTDVRCDSYLNNRVEYNKYVKDFAACYRKDLEARTEEEILRPTTKPLAYLYGVSNVFIFEDYENTW
ncbi:MAG: hypothetical protein GX896_05125, partial [Clostridiales bacterium]|nr:hypothetical protein [Clostridiales bacterium]